MPRQYTNLKQYEETILQMKAKGCTRREIAENLGITPEQVHGFVKRHNKNLRNIETGVLPKKKGRPSKVKSLEDEVLRLRMENELLRDFLSLTERK
jgi:DNA-directed RNA polymerase specialized sigma subunit